MSRWPWSHHFIGTALSRSGIVVIDSLSWLLHKTLDSSNQVHLHLVRQLPDLDARHPFVAMSTMFDLVDTCFRCQLLLIHFLSRPQPSHATQSQRSTSVLAVSPVFFFDKCVSSIDLSLLQISVRQMTFCVTDHLSSQWSPCINAPAVVDNLVVTSPAQPASV